MGVDMWAAELLLRMKEQQAYQDVELCLALPFEGYNADWDDWHRKRMDFIRRYAEKVLVLGEMPSSESYKKRNYYMVEQAGHMIAVYDNSNNAVGKLGDLIIMGNHHEGLVEFRAGNF